MNTLPLGLYARRLATLLGVLGLWQLSAGPLGWVDPFYLPPPAAIGATLVQLFADGGIYSHLEATFGAALMGLALGLLVGALCGFVAALVPLLAELLEPVMVLLNAIPRVILAPLFIIWLGIGIGSKVALSFILVVVLTFFSVYNGIRAVDASLVERVRTLGGGTWVLLREVYVPSVVSWVMSNLRVSVGFAFTGAVVGEFVASTRGLGYLLSFAQSTYNAALSLALIFLVVVVVMLLFAGAGWLERRLLRWKYR
ncbi:MAG TPA: ABC transporter permease [Salinisphaeraceae bacterium]|nr:ABC transporter permease [Salinisphaeraceae bacterium]